jgi:hypothetical protein
LNLKKKEMQMRKALIVCKGKWKKLPRRCEITRLQKMMMMHMGMYSDCWEKMVSD